MPADPRPIPPLPPPKDAMPGAMIELPADPLSVRSALARLVGQLHHLGLEDEELGAVELVAAEALNNVVEHAYPSPPDDMRPAEITLSWTFGATGLHIKIEDGGDPMPAGKPPLSPHACARDHAALVPEGGFGWFLIQGLAHNIVYRRDRGRNVLTFRMVVGVVG